MPKERTRREKRSLHRLDRCCASIPPAATMRGRLRQMEGGTGFAMNIVIIRTLFSAVAIAEQPRRRRAHARMHPLLGLQLRSQDWIMIKGKLSANYQIEQAHSLRAKIQRH
ncbi:hypothetical protein F444_22769 [Phytophthora nicotianae P1976]|uniref:Uncharacterized protein n=1 Tax=Phytophthora nicotianae P1976 TaxID=1317066 RepID=A0A080YWT6_PHYNI|nr:hypothetical protein F444_22769 [Phytophthora nicotianae P1976]